MKNRLTTATVLAAALALALPSSPARAGDAKKPWWVPRLRDKEVASTQGADEEVPAVAPPPPKPTPAAPAPAPAVPAAAAATAAGATAATTKSATPAAAVAAMPRLMPDESLLKLCQTLRKGPVGGAPNAIAYLDLIESGRATTAQVNDFAAYLAKRGAPKAALQFQQYAVKLDPNDPTLELNLGTIYQTLRQFGPAESAFRRSLAIDPNNGLAHYNLGSIYDSKKDYDNAVEQYRIALVLDPDLGDPRKNPQVVNNEHLLAVKLKIYQNQSGALGLPLKQMQPAPPPVPAPAHPEKH